MRKTLLLIIFIASLGAGCSHPYLIRDGKIDDEYLARVQKSAGDACGVPFGDAIASEVLTPEQAAAKLKRVFDDDIGPDELRPSELALVALGLAPGGSIDLRGETEGLVAEQAIGFYVPKEKKYFVIDGAAPSGFFIWLASCITKRDLINEMIASHELVHALQDRKWDLEKYRKAASKNDDEELARRAVVEGHATLAGLRAMGLDARVALGRGQMLAASGERMEHAPPIVRETLVFPYYAGLAFIQALGNSEHDVNGYAVVDVGGISDAPFERAPRSTTEIMHPKKYFAGWQPRAVELGAAKAPAGWRLVRENVVGEAALRVMLEGTDESRPLAAAAAAGWDGDRYRVFEDEKTRALALAWVVNFETPDDAAEMIAAYRAFLGAEKPMKRIGAGSCCAPLGEMAVAIVEAPDAATIAAIGPVALGAKVLPWDAPAK